jgi:hypothetical protein
VKGQECAGGCVISTAESITWSFQKGIQCWRISNHLWKIGRGKYIKLTYQTTPLFSFRRCSMKRWIGFDGTRRKKGCLQKFASPTIQWYI